jgi:hypothetical protein
MIENRNTKHPRIVGNAFRKANSFFDLVMTKSHLKRYCLSLLKFHVSEQLCLENRTHANNGDFRASLEVFHCCSRVTCGEGSDLDLCV